jgi:hypothetical protein
MQDILKALCKLKAYCSDDVVQSDANILGCFRQRWKKYRNLGTQFPEFFSQKISLKQFRFEN